MVPIAQGGVSPAQGGVARKEWRRFVLPSIRDLLFLPLFWALLAGPLASRPLADADVGWHIRTGERILTTHSIPRTDPFSSTMQGQPWVAWEWLYDLLLGILHRACGLNGVVWLAALVIATAFAILLGQMLRRGTGLPLAILLWLVVLGASSIHLFARPHIVSWLFTLLWFVALEQWEQGNAPRWLRWFFPVSMALWVNLHAGWLLGLALLAIYVIAAWVDSLRSADALARVRFAHRARAMGWMFAWSALASLVNPYGARLHVHIYRYLSDRYLMDRIDEFRSPDFHGWAQRCFALILMLALIALVWRHRNIRLSQLLVALAAVYAGLYASRNLPVSSMLLVLVTGPILWEVLTSLGEHPGGWRPMRRFSTWIRAFGERTAAQESQLWGHLWPIVAVIAALTICLQGGRLSACQVVQAQFDAQHLPVAAAEYLAAQPGVEPLFSSDAWGGYLIYRLYPQRRVVIDDRHDLYGSGRFREYLILMQGEPAWKEVLEKWRIQTLVLPTGSTLANLLREQRRDYRPVYEDKVAVVIKRRLPADRPSQE